MTVSAQQLVPNSVFANLASEEQIARTIQALKENGIDALVVDSGEEARRKVLDLLPDGAEVFTSSSATLTSIGLADEIDQSERFRPVRPRLLAMNRETQDREMRKLGASPDVVVGSVHAVTEQGKVLIASGGGSQLASYVYGASKVIWVVGTQKIVKDIDEGMRRINEYTYPLEDARVREVYGRGSFVAKILLIQKELKPDRITLILVKENLGF